MASLSFVAAGSSVLQAGILTVFRHSRILPVVVLWPSKGEVHVQKLNWLPIASLNQGRYVIRPFECKVTGKAEGCARVKASIHTLLTSFGNEEWRIITLFVGHLDSWLKYTDLFAPSCGSIGEFIDIVKDDEGYVVPKQMREFNFPIRNFDGAFYEQVYPFTPSYFSTKVHPTGTLLFTPHHSQLTLLQHICIQSQYAKKPLQLLSDIPKYWLEEDGTMHLDDGHRWRSKETLRWLQVHGLRSVPRNIKEEIGSLVYNLDGTRDSDVPSSPPGLWLTSDRGRASNDPPPGL